MNFEKGFALYKEGNFEAALTIFHELILQERENPTFYLYRGRILTRLGKGLEAFLEEGRREGIHCRPENQDKNRVFIRTILIECYERRRGWLKPSPLFHYNQHDAWYNKHQSDRDIESVRMMCRWNHVKIHSENTPDHGGGRQQAGYNRHHLHHLV